MAERKLVRDNIPDIIAGSEGRASVRTAESDREYLDLLRAKVTEEVQEYLASGDVEELADIVEVVLALADATGVLPDRLEQIRVAKRDARGGFAKRLVLLLSEK